MIRTNGGQQMDRYMADDLDAAAMRFHLRPYATFETQNGNISA
ncbi:hypothetical protein DEV91_1663 [Phyllobacterium brassicacearum]|nr:hypothetical protein DEV91_1663 [Phyllobacterium brassicacearum]